MALHLITGYAGEEHITSNDQGAYNAATFGDGMFILDRGNKFGYTTLSNNSIQIADGEAMMKGRFIKMPSGTTETVTIENGTQGMKRNDLICIRYEKSSANAVESARLIVLKGVATTDTPSDPEYIDGDITDGTDTVNDMPLYRVSLNGINVETITPLYEVKVSMVKYMDNYQLPIASKNILGGVQVGTGINVNAKGVISVPELTATGNEYQPVFVNSEKKIQKAYRIARVFHNQALPKAITIPAHNYQNIDVKILYEDLSYMKRALIGTFVCDADSALPMVTDVMDSPTYNCCFVRGKIYNTNSTAITVNSITAYIIGFFS